MRMIEGVSMSMVWEVKSNILMKMVCAAEILCEWCDGVVL